MNTMKWAICKKYPGYVVTRDGQVMDLAKQKILNQSVSTCGYKIVSLKTDEGKWRAEFVHRLVGWAYVDNPNGYNEINHIDEDKTNNNADNLEWCTRKYNNSYGTRGTRIAAGRMGGDNPNARPVEVYGKYYGSVIEAMRALNLTRYEVKKIMVAGMANYVAIL